MRRLVDRAPGQRPNLARRLDVEPIDRERRTTGRRLKASMVPAAKSLDGFDVKAIPALNRMQVLELAR